MVVSLAIVVAALATVTEVVLPVMLAALLAVVFKPAADALVRRSVRPSIASVLVIVGLGVMREAGSRSP